MSAKRKVWRFCSAICGRGVTKRGTSLLQRERALPPGGPSHRADAAPERLPELAGPRAGPVLALLSTLGLLGRVATAVAGRRVHAVVLHGAAGVRGRDRRRDDDARALLGAAVVAGGTDPALDRLLLLERDGLGLPGGRIEAAVPDRLGRA